MSQQAFLYREKAVVVDKLQGIEKQILPPQFFPRQGPMKLINTREGAFDTCYKFALGWP